MIVIAPVGPAHRAFGKKIVIVLIRVVIDVEEVLYVVKENAIVYSLAAKRGRERRNLNNV